MTQATHTPGPWYFSPYHTSFGVTTRPNGGYGDRVAECDYWTPAVNGKPDRATAEANARLIASAPDLLEALQKVLPRLSHKFECWSCRPIEEWEEHGSASFENCECEIKTARAAIAKALGEQA